MNHICTIESFIVQDLGPLKARCPICCQMTVQHVTWAGILCSNCNREFGPDYTSGHIVKNRREYCKKTRKEWSKLVGNTIKTIKFYEYHYPSECYLTRTGELVKKFNLERKVDNGKKTNRS